MYKFVLASALLAVAFAAGPPAYGPPAPYQEEKLAPQPFAYEYGVNDDYSKANFKKTEPRMPAVPYPPEPAGGYGHVVPKKRIA